MSLICDRMRPYHEFKSSKNIVTLHIQLIRTLMLMELT